MDAALRDPSSAESEPAAFDVPAQAASGDPSQPVPGPVVDPALVEPAPAAATEDDTADGSAAEPEPEPDVVAGSEDVAPSEPTDEDEVTLAPESGAAAEPSPEPVDSETDTGPTDEPELPAPPPAMIQRTVSAEIARQLHALGARFCFTVPAEPILTLLDDLAEVGIRVVTARHEGSAAFMAEALAQSTGRPQVVAVSRAVGASNAAIGIHTASQDSATLVALVGQVRTELRGREAFQAADVVGSIGSLASWAAQIDTPGDAVAVLEQAWRRLTTGRPGPIVLSIPSDVQSSSIELRDEPLPQPPGARGGAADRVAVSRALKMLAASERGVILAGGGVLGARATKRLIALSEALAVPVIAAWRRPDVFPNDHVNYLGMAGPWAAPTVPQRLEEADVIMFIGARLSDTTTAGYRIPAPETRWIHVDVQPQIAHAGLPAPTLSIAADASRFLDTAWSDLRAAALDNEMRSRREARIAADREAYRIASEVGQGTWAGPGLHPGEVVMSLRAALPDNAIVATDAGNLAAFVGRGFRFRRAGTFVGATSGSMGFGLPAAIAASLLDPDRISVAVCGDGGFAMAMPELETAVREGAHPIAVVLDNQRYGTIALQLSREGRETRTSDLGPIDFAAVARAHGAVGFSVSAAEDFDPALREAITSRRTSVIHVAIDRSWRSVDESPVVVNG